MPKWFGMMVHYITFKKILCSQEDWMFGWKWHGEHQFVSPIPISLPRYQVHPDGSRTQIENFTPSRWGGRLWLSDE